MKDKVVRIDDHLLTLTNLDKVFWPDEGTTKGELLLYYDGMADYILPHLKDRPQSLNRFPDGINGPSFYQKNVPHHPTWVKIHKKKDETGKVVNYVICNDKATLLYLVNLGCIEINVWSSRREHPERPDFLVLDLDPLEVDYRAVCQVALVLYQLLQELDIAAYPKTSGKKGLHVYIPLAGDPNFDEVRDLAHLICLKVHDLLPKTTSLERSPRKRRGRVYLDYLQNRPGSTMAAPYSVRPVVGATVSMPLEWSEVERSEPRDFNIHKAKSRVEERGDLFLPTLEGGIGTTELIRRLEELA